MSAEHDYDRETRNAYRDPSVANRYSHQHHEGWSWARLMMWREVRFVAHCLRRMELSRDDLVLDVPCGTGILGETLSAVQAGRILPIDISREMMAFAHQRYAPGRLTGFVQGDITRLPLASGGASGTLVLGFMHRVPLEIKLATLKELRRVSSRFLIVSFTVNSLSQRVKRWLLSRLRPSHRFAPAPMDLEQITALCHQAGFTVRKTLRVAPPLSGEVVFWLEPAGPQSTAAAPQ